MARLRDLDGVSEARTPEVNHPGKIQVLKGFNARRKFVGIDDLAQDILSNGVLTPLWVRRDRANEDQPFILIDGERRHKALCKLFEDDPELELRIPLHVFDVDDEEAEDLMAKACFQREDFLTSEKVTLVQRYQKRGLSNQEIAGRLSMSTGWVDQMSTLAASAKAVKAAVDSGKITLEAALMIARKTKAAQQEKALDKVLRLAGGSKRKTSKAAAEVTGTNRRPGKKEVLGAARALSNADKTVESVDSSTVAKLVILALNYSVGEVEPEEFSSACVDAMGLVFTPPPEPAPAPPKRRGRPPKAKPVEPAPEAQPEAVDPEPSPEPVNA